MLCYRCGSHVQDGADNCWNCGTRLASAQRNSSSSLAELREKQKTKGRLAGVVYKVGDLIGNRYQVKDVVGSGGAGVVYRAHDQEIDVDVALKVINAKLLQTADEKRLLSKEIKSARKLNHQNIVRIYDEGKDGERAFFTMQFLEGLSLRKIIDLRQDKQQHFRLNEIEPIYNQLCQALDYAHRTALHGNIKPDNILVLPDLLKVTDFGLLRGLPRKPFLAIQKARGSNFRYLAPEVRLEVEEITPAADIYSLGVILIELLTGTVYDDGKPEQVGPGTGLDTAVLRVMRRCVSRVPKERYAAAGDLYEDLRQLVARGEAPTARPAHASPPPVPGPSVAPPPVEEPPPKLPSIEKAAPAAAPPPPPNVDAPIVERAPVNPAEAPTQRLDISEHGARPIVEKVEEPSQSKRPSKPPPPPPATSEHVAAGPSDPPEGAGTGTFAPIEDDMIEAAAAGSGVLSASRVSVPAGATPSNGSAGAPSKSAPAAPASAGPAGATPAKEKAAGKKPVDGDEPPDAIEEFADMSSQIELIADPRSTNVIDIDPQRVMAQKKIKEAVAAAGAAAGRELSGLPGKTGSPAGSGDAEPAHNVIVNLSDSGSAKDKDKDKGSDKPADAAPSGPPVLPSLRTGDVAIPPPLRTGDVAVPPPLRTADVAIPPPLRAGAGSATPEPAFAKAQEQTEAGRLDIAAKSADDNKSDPTRAERSPLKPPSKPELPSLSQPRSPEVRVESMATDAGLGSAVDDKKPAPPPPPPARAESGKSGSSEATLDSPFPDVSLDGAPPSARAATAALPSNGTNGTSSAADAAARAAKARPATRPRMSALGDEVRPPAVVDPSAHAKSRAHDRPQLRPRMGGTLDPAERSSSSRSPQRDGSKNQLIIFGLIALLALGMFAFYMDSSNKRQAMELAALRAQMEKIAEDAKSRETAAREEVKTADDDVKKADEAKADAKKQAEEAQKKKEDALAAAKKAEADAAALAATQKVEADRLKKEAEEQRKQAELEAKKEQAERDRIAAEEKKKADAEEKKRLAEERAEKEKQAKLEAQAKAEQLKADKAAAAEEAKAKKAEADAKRAEELAAKKAAAEEAKKLKEEEAKRKADEAEVKKAEAKDPLLAELKRAEIEAKKAEERKRVAADKELDKIPEAPKDTKKTPEPATGGGDSGKAAAVAAAATTGGSCPKGMAMVAAGAFMMGAPRNDPERNFGDLRYESKDLPAFCVDYYEAPNGRDREPVTKVSYDAAEKQCKAKGKRLCSEAEWEKACKGPSGLRYPYGNQWDPAACATEDDEGNDRELSKSGSFKTCRSGYNVFDLSGNAAEWTSTQWEGGGGQVVKGGSAQRPGYDGRCAARTKKKGGDANEMLGYRCCADPK